MSIYFDHAATALWRPEAVGLAVLEAMNEASGNPGRGGHRLALRSARIVEGARDALAALFGIEDAAHVVFTKNATEAVNLLLFGFLREGDRVLLGSFEHNAVLRPLRALERDRRVRLEFLPPSAGGPLDLDFLKKQLLREPVRLVVLTAASNVTGEVFPVAQAGALCRAHNASFLVDAAQAAGVVDLRVERDGIDFLAVTGHKSLLGPTGTGALYLRDAAQVQPLLHGGTGSRSEEEEQPPFLPDRFEAGTQNVAGLAGLAAGVRHVRGVGLEILRGRHRALATYVSERLCTVPGIVLYGPAAQGRLVDSLAVVSFNVRRASGDGFVDPARLAQGLDARGVFCRAGLHCASRAHRTIGTFPMGTVRFSLSPENTEAEIDVAVEALREIVLAIPAGDPPPSV